MKCFLIMISFWLVTSISAQPKRDTVKVIVLYSDTANVPGLSTPYQQSNIYHKVNGVWWEMLYKIREWHNEMEGEIDPGFYSGRIYKNYTIDIGYLDMQKQPLKESIIIWQSKEAK